MYWFECPRSLIHSQPRLRGFLDAACADILLERVCDQGEDFLVLIEQQAGGEVS